MNLQRQQDGYAMAALLIAMSIMAVMMTVAMPTWRQMAQREKEAELVFRGEQYGRALTLFQNKNGPGTSPPNFDLLVEQRYLRKKYKDPVTNDDFVPILLSAGQPGGTTPGSTAPGAQQGTPRGGLGTPPQQVPTIQGRGTGGTTGATTPGAGPTGGIAGVTSKSKEQSIRLYKGRNHYNEWQFTPVIRTAAPGAGGQGAPGTGGQRGGQRGNQNPQGPQNPFGGVGGRRGTPPGGGGPFPGNPFPNGPNNPNGPTRPGPPPPPPGRPGP
jgi:type II secretory pathway pseudopilin PulG